MPLIDVNADNVTKTGFFCYMSKRKTEGFRRKLAWVQARAYGAASRPRYHARKSPGVPIGQGSSPACGFPSRCLLSSETK